MKRTVLGEKNMDKLQHNQAALDRIKDRDTFVYFLDMELKRVRRYQDFFSIILLRLVKSAHRLQDVAMETVYDKVKEILAQEARETDILGDMEEGKIAILLPYADAKLAELAQQRFNDLLEPCDFIIKGLEINFKRFCFPSHARITGDILQEVLDIPS